MFKVIRNFTDLEDNSYKYKINDIYPHNSRAKVSNERINSLLSANNRIGKPVIETMPLEDITDEYIYPYAKFLEIKIPRGSKVEDIRNMIEELFESKNEPISENPNELTSSEESSTSSEDPNELTPAEGSSTSLDDSNDLGLDDETVIPPEASVE